MSFFVLPWLCVDIVFELFDYDSYSLLDYIVHIEFITKTNYIFLFRFFFARFIE